MNVMNTDMFFEILFNDNKTTKKVIICAENREDAVRIFRENRRKGFKTALEYPLPFVLTGFLLKKLPERQL